jgi:hypothetical protein
MAEQTIIGVDFSGAKAEGKTWMTEGKLNTESRTLKLQSCNSIKRNKLTERLEKRDYSVAALDFPFSVPMAFATYLEDPSSEMPDLWACIASMCLDEFIEKRNCFVGENKKKEYLRAGDLHVSGCYSCLHDTNPNMVPMTYYGMKMLHQLSSLPPECSFEIPPLEKMDQSYPVLLEVMPGAALNRFGLPATNPGKAYKKKRDSKARDRRKEIVDNLADKSGIVLCGLDHYRETCHDNDDALDSMVAAVVAALWAMDECKAAFEIPQKYRPVAHALVKYKGKRGKREISPGIDQLSEESAARREGWIYTPVKK